MSWPLYREDNNNANLAHQVVQGSPWAYVPFLETILCSHLMAVKKGAAASRSYTDSTMTTWFPEVSDSGTDHRSRPPGSEDIATLRCLIAGSSNGGC